MGMARKKCAFMASGLYSILLNGQGFAPDWIERQQVHKEKNTSHIAYNYLGPRTTAWRASDIAALLEKLTVEPEKK